MKPNQEHRRAAPRLSCPLGGPDAKRQVWGRSRWHRTATLVFGLTWGVLVWGQSSPAAVTPQNLRSLLIQALQSPQGEAHGILSGPEAQAIQKQFGASNPLRIDVRTVKRFAQPGCARLEATFSQDVKLPDAAAARPQSVTFGINYCLDGRPPGATP